MLNAAEEFLLLLLDEENGTLLPLTPRTEQLALAGAVLVDLQHHYRIDTDLDNLTLVDAKPVGDDVLDPTLADIAAADETHDALYWVERTAAQRGVEIRDRVVAKLVARGILVEPDEDGFLALTPQVAHGRRYPAVNGEPQQEDVKLRVMRVLFNNEIPDPADIVIIGLADACNVWRKILPSHELPKARERIEIVSKLDLVGQAVARLVRVVRSSAGAGDGAVRALPVAAGLPLVGSTVALARSQRKFYVSQYNKLGPIFRVNTVTRNFVCMAGQEANQFMGRSERAYLHTSDMWDPLSRAMGAGRFVLNMNGTDHVRMRREMKQGFSRTLIEKQLPRAVEVIDKAIDQLPRDRTMPGLLTVQRLIAETTGMIAAGASTGDYVEDVLVLMRGMMKRGVFSLPIPRTPRLRKASRRISELSDRLLVEHQLHQRGRKEDVVDDLLGLHQADPMFMPETDLGLNALLPLFAGLDTASAVSSCMLYVLLTNDELRERVRAEGEMLFSGGDPRDTVRKLDVTHRVMLETMRMYTPGPGQMRKVATSFDFNGYRISAGETVTIAASVTHDLPEHFPDPFRFDIDRYLPGREEHKKPGVYAPFGLGVHHCAGRGLAEMQIPMIMAGLMYKTDIALHPSTYKLKVVEVPFLCPDDRFRFRVGSRAH